MDCHDKFARKEAYDELVGIVYHDLRRRARQQLGRQSLDGVRPTALVNDLYEKLLGYEIPFQNREHFFNAAGSAMRRLLIDRARKLRAAKRGGGHATASLEDEDAAGIAASDPDLLIDLDRALETLRPEQVRMVELRFFAGFTLEETAELMGLGIDAAKKRWLAIKTLLFDRLSSGKV